MPHAGAALGAPVRLARLLTTGLRLRPGASALIALDETWSWSELERRTDLLAASYLALGLEPGDRVASLMPNRAALIAHYLACFKAGLVMTPLNYRYTPKEIDHALSVSGARIILAHAERAADIAASSAASLPLGVISYAAKDTPGPRFESLIAGEVSLALPEPSREAPAAIFFTSGSTGPAKGGRA
jgi:long-chain acyl-CoA synthetase